MMELKWSKLIYFKRVDKEDKTEKGRQACGVGLLPDVFPLSPSVVLSRGFSAAIYFFDKTGQQRFGFCLP